MKNKQGQHTIEFAVLIAVVVAAIVGGGIYIQRSIQAKLKLVEGQINEAPDVNASSSVSGITSCVNSCDASKLGKNCCSGGTCTKKYAGCAAEHRGVCTSPKFIYVCY